MNNSAPLYEHLVELFSTTAVRERNLAHPPTSVSQLLYATSLFFFCLGFFFVHWHLCNRGGKIFSLSSPQIVEIFKEEVGGRLAPPASFPYCCRSLAVHHKMSPHAHCIVALSPLYVLPFFFPLKLFHIANLAIISCCLNYISSLWSYISRLK